METLSEHTNHTETCTRLSLVSASLAGEWGHGELEVGNVDLAMKWLLTVGGSKAASSYFISQKETKLQDVL